MFSLNTQLIFGPGSTSQLSDLLVREDWTDVTVLIDETVASQSGYWREVLVDLEANSRVCVITLRSTAEPTYAYLDEVADAVRAISKVDVIVGIGGGSALDITKAVAALRTNPGPGIAYRGFDNVLVPAIPSVCIPTTAGTGSEVTINAVFTDELEMRKLGINGRFMSPTYAILDAHWTASCPRNVAMSSGLDALVHSLESYMTRNATQVTRTLSGNAFALIYANLPRVLANSEDIEARQSMLLGSYFAAAALFNSGSGVSGALSYPIGVHYHVPHGIAGGITLPSLVSFNVERGWDHFGDLVDLVAPSGAAEDAGAKSRRFRELIDEMYYEIGVPNDFSTWHLGINDLPRLTELVAPLQAAFDQNPISFSAGQDAPRLLASHLK